MKNRTSFYIALISVSIIISSFAFLNSNSGSDVKIRLAFITHNDFGNNLYIDNISVGSRKAYDLEITNIKGFPRDTTFLPGVVTKKIAPSIIITNVGISPSTGTIKVFLKIDELSYFDSTEVAAIASGLIANVALDSIEVLAGFDMTIKTWISNPNDSNTSNDTITFVSHFKQGFKKNVLIESFTSATSPSSSANDPYLNLFVNQKFENVSAIKYHRNVPEPGNDSMYLANPEQSDSLRDYYFNFQVPTSILNGHTIIRAPYGTLPNVQNPYDTEIDKGTPVEISVTDTLIDNVITSNVTVNISSNLSEGNWRLKFAVVERFMSYDSIPDAWTQEEFFDVFKKAIPGVDGVPVPSTQGVYNFTYSYSIEEGWADSMIYSIAYIQNDIDRQILNSGKSLSDTIVGVNIGFGDNQNVISTRDFDKEFPSLMNNRFYSNSAAGITEGSFFLQNFEGGFLPFGWRKSQSLAFVSFREAKGVNGTLYGGENSVVMPFYDNSLRGTYDTLFSPVITGLNETDTIRFNYAYAQFMSTFVDSLKILLSTNGGESFDFEIFNKGGEQLATAPSTTIQFSPTGANQWKLFEYPLQNIFTDFSGGNNPGESFELFQNFPNPFNPVTNIRFFSPGLAPLSIDVYDVSGRLIQKLINENFYTRGFHNVQFDASGLSSGIYFYQLNSGSYSSTRKMILLK